MLEKIQGEKNTRGDKTSLYRCKETGMAFTRVQGGLHWPGTQQGFVCVVGEEASQPLENGRRPLYLLYEAYADSLVDLAQQCVFLKKEFFVDDWVADCTGKNEMYEAKFYELGQEQSVPLDAFSGSLPQAIGPASQVLRHRWKENSLLIPQSTYSSPHRPIGSFTPLAAFFII